MSLLFQDFSKSKRVASIRQLNLPVLLVSVFLPIIKLQMQFTLMWVMTWLNQSSRKALLLFSNIERLPPRARVKSVFSHPVPRIPAINLTQATYKVEAFKRAPDSIGVMYINKNCKFMYFNETYALLLQQLETRVSF